MAELVELEKSVQSFKLPTAYGKDWEDTRLAQRLDRVHLEYRALHAALDREKDWLRTKIDEDQKLLLAGNAVYGDLLNKKTEEERRDDDHPGQPTQYPDADGEERGQPWCALLHPSRHALRGHARPGPVPG